MANKMTAAEIKATAKVEVAEMLKETLTAANAEMVGLTGYIPLTIGDQEVWVEVKLTTKNWTDTKVSKAFDPFVAREEYETEQEIKRADAERKAKEKEEKAKAKAAKSKAKAE